MLVNSSSGKLSQHLDRGGTTCKLVVSVQGVAGPNYVYK